MAPTYKRGAARRSAIVDSDSGLPALTQRQEAFANALLEGSSPIEAYSIAYNAQGMCTNTLNTESWKARKHPKISQYIRHFQRIGLDQTKVSHENHLAELARGREIAYDLGQASAGIQAEHYRGRVSGLYNDKLTLQVGPTDEALLGQIANLLGEDMAQAISDGLTGDKPQTIDHDPTPESRLLSRPGDLD